METKIEVDGKKYQLKEAFNSCEVQFALIQTGLDYASQQLELIYEQCKLQLEEENLLEESQHDIAIKSSPVFMEARQRLGELLFNPESKVINQIFPLVFEYNEDIDYYSDLHPLDVEKLWFFFTERFSLRKSELLKPSNNSASTKKVKKKTTTR